MDAADYPTKLRKWAEQPGAHVTQLDEAFLMMVWSFASMGMGYGQMQQLIEWEWQDHGPGAWGPEYFETQIRELERQLDSLTAQT